MSNEVRTSRILTGFGALLFGIAWMGSEETRNDTFVVHAFSTVLYAIATLLFAAAGVKEFLDRRR